MTLKQQLDRFLKKYDPEIASIARRALAKMRKRNRGGGDRLRQFQSAGDRIRAEREGVDGYFFHRLVSTVGESVFSARCKVARPHTKVAREAKVVRSVRLEDDTLEDPKIQNLMDLAIARAKVPIDPSQRRRLVIRSASATAGTTAERVARMRAIPLDSRQDAIATK